MPLARIDLAEGKRSAILGPSEKSSTDSAAVPYSNRRRSYKTARFVQMESR